MMRLMIVIMIFVGLSLNKNMEALYAVDISNSLEQAAGVAERKNDFWEQYVYMDVMGQTCDELFSTLSTYYFLKDGVEVLYPYEDFVYFNGPAWERDSIVVIANFVNRGGYDYLSLIEQSYGDEIARVYDDHYQRDCVVITDRGYELRYYYLENGYTEFFEYRKDGYVPPDRIPRSDLITEIPGDDGWAFVREWANCIGRTEGDIPPHHESIEVTVENFVCTAVRLKARDTCFAGKTVRDLIGLGIPLTLYGDENDTGIGCFVYEFRDGIMVQIECSVMGDIGVIEEESLITIKKEREHRE